MSSSSSQYEYILLSRPDPSVLLVTLNRPKSLNALCSPLFNELNQALEDADKDDSVGAMVLTGSEKAFAGLSPPHNATCIANSKLCVPIAGADIKEMKDKQCEQTPSWSYIY
jgi:enoyl-CoA hydratase